MKTSVWLGCVIVLSACTSEAPVSNASAASSASASTTTVKTTAPEDGIPPLLRDTRTPTSPAETDPLVATVEELPAKYSCATLSARGRKLGKLPKRTADAYAKCQTALAASGTPDLRACLQLAELLKVAPKDEVLSDNVSTRACARGSQRACRNLAESRLGDGVRFDPICAEKLLDTLCTEGELGSCFRLGSLKIDGELVVEDAAGGRALIERACNQGAYMACHDIVMRGKELSDTEKRTIIERAFEAATKACNADDADACDELAWAYAHSGQWYYLATPKEDEAKQRELRRRACALGSMDGCSRLERRDRTDAYKDDCDEEREACVGATDPTDPTQHEEWLFQRCAAGWDTACDGLGRLFRRPKPPTAEQIKDRGTRLESGCLEGAAGACGILLRGKLVELEASEKVIRTACDLGLASSCEKLAAKAEAAGDRALQLQYLERACPVVTPQGRASISRSACRVAGIMYKDGVGAPKDLERAAILLQKGCTERRYVQDGEACVVLGTMFEDGIGVQKSLSRALDLYAAGCDDEGYEDQIRSRAESRARLHGGPEPPPHPARKEPTACARLRKWEEKPKKSLWGE